MAEEILVGIDLGTTNSAIAYVNDWDRPEVLPNSEGNRVTPSVVQIRSDGSALAGEIAKQEVALEKENTAQFFKRDIGTSAMYEYHGRGYTPTDLSAEVLKKLKSDSEKILGKSINRAVITVPAYFHDGPRIATRTAGEMAGLNVVQMINEPTAAAIAYGMKLTRQDEVIMVYDLGGGTFDISLVHIAPGTIEVIGTDGNHNLGGKDWDDRLVQHFCEEFMRRHNINPLDDPYTFQELLIRAEEAKKTLSARLSATVPINCEGKMDRIEVTREMFEDLTRDLILQTEILMGKVLDETGYDYSRVSSVLMVGGSTRMPICLDLVKQLTGKAPNTSVNPDECVALGAAIQASEYAERKNSSRGVAFIRKENVRDVMSHSMGMIAVSASGERYINSTLISKNLAIPCREMRPYLVGTRKGGDNSTFVYVTQGEGEDPANCSFVGKYIIRGISHVEKGKAVLDIAYEYDRSGVVSVSATERSTSRELTVLKEPIPEDMSWIFRSPKEVAAVAHKTIYLAVDLSGSMSGAPLKEAKHAIRTFITSSDLSHTSIGLVSFADRVQTNQPSTQDGRALDRALNILEVGGELGIGNQAHPFDEALRYLSDCLGLRYFVVLTDGVWSYQDEAERRAKDCHKAGIEIIAIGFGSADEAFLRRIATSDQSALLVDKSDLASTFGSIAQVLVENEGLNAGSGGLMRWRR